MSHSHPDLGPPPELPRGGLRVVALGGVGEVGRNMTVLEYDGRLLIVDCGVLFPEDDQPGIDLILPDFDPIRERLEDIEAVVLTHGHEDHIGGVPYLLRERPDIPLVGSRFTLALVEAKLREHRIEPFTLTVHEGNREKLGPFECEFFAVNHSIPDSLAVAVRTGAGLLLHTGDFKCDLFPLDGRRTDLAGFSRLGDEGIDLLLADSTNAEVPGFVTPERNIGEVLDRLFLDAPSRIIVASFASHVHRVQQVLDAAYEHRRKVAYVGRSMIRNMGIARDVGLLEVPDGLVVSLDEAAALPPREVVLISTGSQGEPLSALSRMATREHRQIRLEKGDVVILASSLVPGNETAVFRVVNKLSRLGTTVIHKGTARVHVSGHAPAGELALLHQLCRPRHVIPVHGEWRHLRAHAGVATASGVPAERVLLVDDGVVVDLVDGKAAVTGVIETGSTYVDGAAVGDVGEVSLKDRRILRDEGFIAVTLVVDSSTGQLVGRPTVAGRGFSDEPGAFEAVAPLIEQALQRAADDGVSGSYELSQRVRRVVGKWVSDTYRRRPMIVPSVVEV